MTGSGACTEKLLTGSKLAFYADTMWKNLQHAVLGVALMMPLPIAADDKKISLGVPDELVNTGFLKHLLPRFSLKTQVRISLGPTGEVALGDAGVPVFKQADRVWHLSGGGDGDVKKFRDWLTSDIGKRTIDAFSGDGGFSSDVEVQVVEVVQEISGDVVLGEQVSLQKCGRCHVVNEKNRMNGMGSSPSFRLMRTFSDWQNRFEAFFALKPHPAFTQVEDVTEPFPVDRPSPIAPIEVTLDEIDAIIAYVAILEPADLGAPIKSQ